MLKLLDAFCGAGGAGWGYHLAGFDVTGIDINPQKHYPLKFIQGDALDFISSHGKEFDVIHSSPPCQFYSRTKFLPSAKNNHPDLIGATRNALIATGKPYVIENVKDSPLINPITLCGSMFGLGVLRHRLFETAPEIWFPPCPCAHGKVMPIFWGDQLKAKQSGKTYNFITVSGRSFLASKAKIAMGINWMTAKELAQAIPPAYTEWLGKQILITLEKI